MKLCTSCDRRLELDQFTKGKWHCRDCAAKKFKAWRIKNIDRIKKTDRIKHYVRTYGLSQELAEQFIEQERMGVCEICKHEHPLVVDHNHTTNELRGFICSFCNSVLGYSRESKEILMSTIKYLEKYK